MNVLLLRDVTAVLLAGGAGERLYPLTRERAKPAVPFGGPYRIIDFSLSNCINSGLRKIFIATQYKAQSLNSHIRRGWNVVNRELGEFIEILPPQKRMGEHWYLGTADAVWQNLYAIERERSRWVIVLAGDHIYKMDYGKMLDVHIARGARLTVAAIEVPLSEARRFGVLEVDAEGRVTGFKEKPESPPSAPWSPGACLGSMGVYIFDIDVLVRELQRDAEADSTHDFGRDIIPTLVSARERVFAYLFWDENKKESQYWRDVGTIDAYYEATMDLVQVDPVFNLYDPEWPMRTYQPQLPPAKFVFDESGRRGCRDAVDRLHGLHRLRRRGAPLDPVPGRADPLLLRRGGLDPAARGRREPPQPHPPRDHRPRGRDPARRRDRLRPRGGPPAPHRLRGRRRGRDAGRGVPDRREIPLGGTSQTGRTLEKRIGHRKAGRDSYCYSWLFS